MFSAQISVAQMKFAAFLKASTKEVSFSLARENLNHSFFNQFRKEVYATPSSRSGIKTTSTWIRFTNSTKDSYDPSLIFDG